MKISYLPIVALLATLSLALGASADEIQPMKISVFYETLCPYSVKFLREQLVPTYLKFKDYLLIDLVPYGNAKTIQYTDGTYGFECQHGPRECYANKLHACAIAHITSKDDLMSYIQCTADQDMGFSKAAGRIELAEERCASTAGRYYEMIQECANGTEGTQLMVSYGVRTHNLVPPVKGVPWILFNDVYYPQYKDRAEEDLAGVACELFTGTKPSGCPVV